MALKTTIEHMKKMLLEISHDLEKGSGGNRAAAQRVRTNTIKFAKIAKQFRKESIAEGRKGGATKKKATKKRAAPKRKATKKRAAPKRKVTKKKVVRRKTTARKPAKRKSSARRRR